MQLKFPFYFEPCERVSVYNEFRYELAEKDQDGECRSFDRHYCRLANTFTVKPWSPRNAGCLYARVLEAPCRAYPDPQELSDEYR